MESSQWRDEGEPGKDVKGTKGTDVASRPTWHLQLTWMLPLVTQIPASFPQMLFFPPFSPRPWLSLLSSLPAPMPPFLGCFSFTSRYLWISYICKSSPPPFSLFLSHHRPPVPSCFCPCSAQISKGQFRGTSLLLPLPFQSGSLRRPVGTAGIEAVLLKNLWRMIGSDVFFCHMIKVIIIITWLLFF